MKLIFSPGYEIDNPKAAVLDFLKDPIFSQILNFTDQVIVLVNNSTLRYEYISENIVNVTGYSAEFLLDKGIPFFLSLFHPEDVPYLTDVIFPMYNQHMEKLTTKQRTGVRLSYDYRIRKHDNTYTRILQHNIALTMENGKPGLSIALVTDISSFKKGDYMGYEMILYKENGGNELLTKGTSKPVDIPLKFSPREKQVLTLVAQGLSEKQIASDLFLSIQTVKSHKKNMIRRYHFKNSVELVRFALVNQII